MRPVYETEETKRVERHIADTFAAAWRCEFHERRKFDSVDFHITQSGLIVAWAEVKQRKVDRMTYPTIILSADKAMHGVLRAELTGKPFLFCIKFNDAFAYAKVRRDHLKRIALAGRVDRGDPADIEPCIDIPIGDFATVETTDSWIDDYSQAEGKQ